MTIGAWNEPNPSFSVRHMTKDGSVSRVGRTLFGMRERPPKPLLLMIVFGLFLMIIGVTAMAQTVLVSLHVANASLNATLSGDAATVRTFVNGLVAPSDLVEGASPERASSIDASLGSVADRGQILRIEIRDPEGVVRLSNEKSAVAGSATPSAAFHRALAGGVDAAIIGPGSISEVVGAPIPATELVREYFPLLSSDGTISGVVAIWRDAAPILAAIDKVRGDVVLVTLSAAIVIAVLLYLIFRAAQRRITRQTEQLVESTRVDALTHLPNHGTLVGELAMAIESSRAEATAIGVILLDLDNFRLINETYGHEAGDGVLRQLAISLTSATPRGWICGRYGPDEFLLIAPSADLSGLEVVVGKVRAQLVDEALELLGPEKLPITVSAGIALYPEHAGSVTELLSIAAAVLAEARASGGDATRVAGAVEEVSAETRSFDVLQGLVFAVDTKDRYTKRHSEDVARYGSFLAAQLGLDAEVADGVRQAGLLHDVGKIGIPDAILRKPGRLTDDEYEIVKQHVALGDSIVRNVANIDIVRTGIRHHHERWDGRGYLTALAGEDIPLVARILAVADAFSAMTTTRPYRKAMTIEEALRRLGDAAGSQFDERVVAAFIHGIETVTDAPLPGIERAASPVLWVPSVSAA